MKHLASVVIVAFLVTASAHTAAAEQWTGDDWLYAPLSGAAGGAGGALAGGLAGSLLDGPCLDPDNDCMPAFTIAGLGAGLIIGSAYGVKLYGKKRGHDGKFSSAVIGALLGNIASGSVVVLAAKTIDNGTIGFPAVIGAIIGFPAVGATIAYKRSRGSGGDDRERASAALLEITPEHVALQAPLVGWSVTDDETAVYVPVAGGTF